jgi:hypothetical protein
MARIPPLTTLRVEDFPSEERKWLPRLFLPLNQFLTACSNTINGRVDFGANIPSQDANLSFTFDGSAQRFRWTGSQQPRILWVGQATEAGLPVALNSSWSYDSSTQVVSTAFYRLDGTALTSGTAYKVFVRAVP